VWGATVAEVVKTFARHPFVDETLDEFRYWKRNHAYDTVLPRRFRPLGANLARVDLTASINRSASANVL